MSDDRSTGALRRRAEQVAILLFVAVLAVLLARTVTHVSWWLLLALAVPLVEPFRRVLRIAIDGGDGATDGTVQLDVFAAADETYEAVGALAAAGVGYYFVASTATHWWIGLAIYALVLLPLFGLAADVDAVPHRVRTVAATLVLGIGLLGTAVSGGAWPVERGSWLLAASPWSAWLPLLFVGLPLVYWYAGRRPAAGREPAAA